jgi:hypothetical protein
LLPAALPTGTQLNFDTPDPGLQRRQRWCFDHLAPDASIKLSVVLSAVTKTAGTWAKYASFRPAAFERDFCLVAVEAFWKKFPFLCLRLRLF